MLSRHEGCDWARNCQEPSNDRAGEMAVEEAPQPVHHGVYLDRAQCRRDTPRLVLRLFSMNVEAIKLLVLDVDGVLTDGGLHYCPDGEVVKRFHVQDGCAIKLWQRLGGTVAIASGRSGQAIQLRAKELGIDLIRTGVDDKLSAYDSILNDANVTDSAVAYVGDDLPDLGPLGRCGFPVAVANAVPAVKRVADYVTRRPGGQGAVAEIVELMLRKQGKWRYETLAEAEPEKR